MSAEVRSVPIDDYRAALGADGQLVDVREDVEVAEGTIPGARHIPLGDLPDRAGELDPARTVVLFCRAGGRSLHGGEYLVGSGFSDVVNLDGGILAFSGELGEPGAGAPTNG